MCAGILYTITADVALRVSEKVTLIGFTDDLAVGVVPKHPHDDHRKSDAIIASDQEVALKSIIKY